MGERGDDTGLLRGFGRQLKLLREREGLSREELGAWVGYGREQIASVEQGRRIPSPELIESADEVLGAGGLLRAMKEELAQARYPAFFRDAARLEARAVEIHVYACQAVPGLLQTEEYARAVFGMMRPPLPHEVIEERVVARMERQAHISDRRPPLMSFVLDESILRRPIGGSGVLREQVERLLQVGRRREVEIQIMPMERQENAGLAGPFTLMETSDGKRVAYLEVQNVSQLHTKRESVRGLEAKYGILRAQALNPRESLTFMEKALEGEP
ncbi:helix-turn-helix transcriptional regulator [Streptomyces calidiresistens]|uniref:Helix-turn-helix domain-containing protein n=1 Tax=Streptomyces calidiresistens TaxID=1485586 RepID=A0A7W3T3C5_9ACTN|nr:helix-turn-helix transcriptional regulator [Streptomyces calidiresistens]MBB0230157.1 helix-turn-helix domain-containing protein [Streptomyces calidiresistens]